MKTNDYEIPEGLYYSKEHEWALVKIDHIMVGITDYPKKLFTKSFTWNSHRSDQRLSK